MKLTSTQIEQTLGQFEAEPIPENHPMVPQLNEVFGEHTYFVNSDGLIILEPTGSGLTGVQSAKVVVVSVGANDVGWSDFLQYCYGLPRCDDEASDKLFQSRLDAFKIQYAQLAKTFDMPEEQIRRIESVLTVTGGDVVYSANPFTAFGPEPLPPVSPTWSPVAAFGGYQRS